MQAIRSHLSGLLSTLLLLFLLAGCGQVRPTAPVVEPAVRTPASPLLTSAHQALDRGELRQAEAYLERAIRLEPRNALLWHTLAQTKYRQENYRQTVQLCLRSNALLAQGAPLTRDNYRLMAEAYRKLGQEKKAREAAQQATAI